MRDREGFDRWAEEYDGEVKVSENAESYPFAGYNRVHDGIFNAVMQKPGAVVLDLGFGTGALTARLYNAGCEIYGQDFSSGMLAVARKKMPEAHLYNGDLAIGLAEPIKGLTYDFIIATYSLHHLTDPRKVELIRELLGLLREDGAILIGDVSFPTVDAREKCRLSAGEEWDDEENYIVAEELCRTFPRLEFTAISHCAGITKITK